MVMPDVNVLIAVHRADEAYHDEHREWFVNELSSGRTIGISDLALSSVMRICTKPRVYTVPSTLEEVSSFAQFLWEQPNVTRVTPGARHWGIFVRLCKESRAKGNLIPDAYFAAMAIEAGAEWITNDRDYARFPGLRWRHPLA